ncbi:MAG: transposase domain-containing protein [Bacteroidales bacterium]|jgi:hypothetical protein|nr:transposase domain-containing protein [Bacteroidales bacterium]MCI2133250.1 transposase domain-containing protein [Bacteroidales bacterium]
MSSPIYTPSGAAEPLCERWPLLYRNNLVENAIVYSLVDSCKALGIDLREWKEDAMLRIHGNENNREALRELLPDKWTKRTN